MPSATEKAWCAGMIDGDGCVTLRADKGRFRHPSVVVDSTDPEILDELTRLYGGSRVTKTRVKDSHRQAWSWRLYGATNIRRFLADIYPYMRCATKRGRARILLEEYPKLTRRNGRYTDAEREAKLTMEARFMAIGHGRGSSARRAEPPTRRP